MTRSWKLDLVRLSTFLNPVLAEVCALATTSSPGQQMKQSRQYVFTVDCCTALLPPEEVITCVGHCWTTKSCNHLAPIKQTWQEISRSESRKSEVADAGPKPFHLSPRTVDEKTWADGHMWAGTYIKVMGKKKERAGLGTRPNQMNSPGVFVVKIASPKIDV